MVREDDYYKSMGWTKMKEKFINDMCQSDKTE